MPRMIRRLVLAASLGIFAGLVACGSSECQVRGENCEAAYKQANNITYGCCDGLGCIPGALSGVHICQ